MWGRSLFLYNFALLLYKTQKMVYNERKAGKRGRQMKYHESEEMYLETILLLKKQRGSVRSVDIATQLDYSRPSVSRAVNLLQNNGFIVIEKTGEINFTEKGQKKATEIYERHEVITQVLQKLGANAEVAEDNACRIEHVVSPEMMQVFKDYVNK